MAAEAQCQATRRGQGVHLDAREGSEFVFFLTDEWRLCVKRGKGNAKVWRRRGRDFRKNCILEGSRHWGGGVMIWRGILKLQKSEQFCFGGDVNALSYIDNAINVGMPPIFHAYHNTMSMHNNASPKNFYRKSPPEKHVDTRFLLAFKVPKLEPSREHLVWAGDFKLIRSC